ncbi:head-tail adaptor protein [Paracoccus yeei]|uniref:head-tail adaptor protein n=1 Tax=Paracoccus yeei TaxID=147645 RepID=UPI0035B21510
MDAAKFDRSITARRKTVTNGPLGATESWRTLCTVWAGRRDVSDGEKAAAGTVMSTLVSRFTVRSSDATRSIRPADTITEGRLTFDVVGIKELGRRDYLEITAQARLD